MEIMDIILSETRANRAAIDRLREELNIQKVSIIKVVFVAICAGLAGGNIPLLLKLF